MKKQVMLTIASVMTVSAAFAAGSARETREVKPREVRETRESGAKDKSELSERIAGEIKSSRILDAGELKVAISNLNKIKSGSGDEVGNQILKIQSKIEDANRSGAKDAQVNAQTNMIDLVSVLMSSFRSVATTAAPGKNQTETVESTKLAQKLLQASASTLENGKANEIESYKPLLSKIAELKETNPGMSVGTLFEKALEAIYPDKAERDAKKKALEDCV